MLSKNNYTSKEGVIVIDSKLALEYLGILRENYSKLLSAPGYSDKTNLESRQANYKCTSKVGKRLAVTFLSCPVHLILSFRGSD